MYFGNFELRTIAEGDQGIDQTVAILERIYRDSIRDPRVIAFAQDLRARSGAANDEAVLASLVLFIRSHLRFTRDPVGLELVKTPDRLLSELETRAVMIGDCDDASVLMATLAGALGYPARFVVVQRDTRSPTFDHIYVESWTGRSWVALDAVANGRQPFFRPTHVRIKVYSS